MRLGRAARVSAAALAAVVLAGCTPPQPGQDGATPTSSPSAADEAAEVEVPESPGDRVAVIVPPSGVVAAAEGNALARVARELAADPPQGIAEVRVSRARSSAFAGDLAELAVDDGYDIVCVVGTGTAELVLELARARRETRFCTTDGRVEGGTVNLVAVAVDPVALVEAGAVAIGTAPAPVGLLASPQLGDLEELTAAFTAAVIPPRQTVSPTPEAPATGGSEAGAAATTSGTTPPSSPPPAAPQPAFVTVEAGSSAAAQANAAEELAAERPSRALVLTTPGGAAAATAVAGAGAQLVVVSDWAVDAEGESPANLLVGLTVDWGELLRAAIASARDPDSPQVQLLGIEAAVLGALPGQVAEGAAAADRTNEHLRRSAE